MPVTLVGFVRYVDDPEKRYFRKVIPINRDQELNEPPDYKDSVTGERKIYRKPDGTPESWTTFGCNPARVAVMDKITKGGQEEDAADARMTATA
jgi:hypothetical protein